VARDNLRCLPPTRTLRRIRWPLQPRSRDHHTAFRLRVMTAGWRSHAILGLGRSFTNESVEADRQASLRPTRSRSRATLARWINRDCAGLGPRSLVPPLFLERCVRAYSRPRCCLPTSATAYDVRATKPELSSPRRDGGRDHLPFLTNHALSLSRAVIRGEPRIVRTTRSRCRFLLLA
jgi:hypothetical protein